MKNIEANKNLINLNGKVKELPVLSYSYHGEKIYEMIISVKRFSDTYDDLVVMFSERLLNASELKIDSIINVTGELRTYNIVNKSKSKLKLVAFSKEISVVNENENKNCAEFEGYICKTPIYRTTPLGREICDVIVAVNRKYYSSKSNKNVIKSSYIPIIAWSSNAKFLSDLKIGDKISCIGRLQSRKYNKVEDDITTEKIAYEISLSKVKKIEEE